ncbi:MAG: putative caspase-like protein, partial [Paracoccaceae bacterium]
GGNSPYASALAQAIRTPGLKIEDAFKQVRRSVLAETDDRKAP